VDNSRTATSPKPSPATHHLHRRAQCEKCGLAGAPALNAEAHEAYLQGLQASNQRTRKGIGLAITNFQRAIAVDPNFALGYAGLARVYSLAPVFDVLRPAESMPKALAAATRAVALDESLAETHTTLAFVKAHYEFDWPAAARAYRRALELNPSDAYAHFFYSNSYLSPFGRHNEAIAEMKTAMNLDPLSLPIQSFAGRTYLWARRYDEAIAQFQRANRLDANFTINHERLAHLYTCMGRFDEAIDEETKARMLAGEDPEGALRKAAALRQALAKRGPLGYWEQLLEFSQTNENPPEAYVTSYGLAIVHSRLGDRGKALDCLERAYAERQLAMTEMGVEPAFDPLRSEPRFVDLLRRVGLSR
jgi:tetratricopeptide (TPR) repeat protein